MLTVPRCKELLGPECRLDDGSIEKLRDQLYALASVALEAAHENPLGTRPRTEGPEAVRRTLHVASGKESA